MAPANGVTHLPGRHCSYPMSASGPEAATHEVSERRERGAAHGADADMGYEQWRRAYSVYLKSAHKEAASMRLCATMATAKATTGKA